VAIVAVSKKLANVPYKIFSCHPAVLRFAKGAGRAIFGRQPGLVKISDWKSADFLFGHQSKTDSSKFIMPGLLPSE
jgi:hypothetical protein